MASTPLLRLDAFDKTFRWQQQIDGLQSATVEPKLNSLGTATFEVASDDPVNGWLQQKGARVQCTYRGKREVGGPVRLKTLGLLGGDTNTYVVEDDWRILVNALAWIVPVAGGYSSGHLDAQSLSDVAQAVVTQAPTAGTDNGYGAYVFDAATRTAETAIKELVRKNLVQRLGRPVTIAADQARGGDAFTAGKLPVLRFDTIADGIAALLAWSGLALQVTQIDGQGFGLDVYQPTPFPQVLTRDSGNIVSGTGTLTPPSATRIVVGGPGDDTARAFLGVADLTREADYNDVIEVLKDASGVNLNWPSSLATTYQVAKYYALRSEVAATDAAAFLAAMTAAGNEGLSDGQPTSGLSMELAETDSFHYGGTDGVQLGAPITAEASAATYDPSGALLSAAVRLTSPVTGATITLDHDKGVQCTTIVGQKADDPDQDLADAIASVQRALRRQAARK